MALLGLQDRPGSHAMIVLPVGEVRIVTPTNLSTKLGGHIPMHHVLANTQSIGQWAEYGSPHRVAVPAGGVPPGVVIPTPERQCSQDVVWASSANETLYKQAVHVH